MTQLTIATKIKSLIESKESDIVAIHGTSINFLTNLISNDGKLPKGGYYANYFYIVLKNQFSKDADLLESAIFYANVNAIKELLFSKYPNFKELILKYNLEHYRFALGLSTLTMDHELADDFKVFSKQEIEQMEEVGRQAKLEKRSGVLIYFSKKLLSDYEIEVDEIGFQARIKVDSPITINYITFIKLLGEYEQTYFNKVLSH